VAVDDHGDVHLAGTFAGALPVPAASALYVAKLGPGGSGRTLRANAWIDGFDVAGDGIRVGARAFEPLDLAPGARREEGAVVAAFDATGRYRWAAAPLPGDGSITTVTHDPDGDTWIAGDFLRPASRPGFAVIYNAAVVSLSRKGAVVDTYRFGSENRSVHVSDVRATGEELVITGTGEPGARIGDTELTGARNSVAFLTAFPRAQARRTKDDRR
jgi:hypothetical protein